MVVKDKNLEEGYGKIHFSTNDEIKEIFKDFREIKIDSVEYTEEDSENIHKSWLVEVRK